ncbi:SCO family protein [Halorhabdus sp. CBA1104]|uniref:SCO family protein n=1 Tax=Halorhabdus sp. CBA1104 TaxID=1380432 RepID=UPI0012B274B0|nr:SCO family protein [Halorhabdus sp. CBA1104]QGN06666.1 SCO family protein [Halorhabdus sp. CBA1104]
MHRRAYLGSLSGGVAALTAGCLGTSGTAETYLAEPDREYDSSAVQYPAYGQQLPEATIADPIAGEAIETTGGNGDQLLTFFYSHCQTVCPRLISALRGVQAKAIETGMVDNVRFRAVTFDPDRDDAERLRQYAKRMDVSLSENWRFLRPDTPDDAKSIVEDTFGVGFERTHPEDMAQYMFTHFALILLVNADDYVERAYTGKAPQWQPIYEDLQTLRNREG